jgi:hypothetical protein
MAKGSSSWISSSGLRSRCDWIRSRSGTVPSGGVAPLKRTFSVEPLVDHQEAAARVSQGVVDLLFHPPPVEGDGDAPQGRGGKDADHVVEAVVGENRQAVALFEAELPEAQCGSPNQPRELRVGDAPVSLDQELAVAVAGSLCDHLDQ